MSKIPVNRLKTYLSELVIQYQSVFVTERIIQDNILIAHEMFHALKTRRSTPRPREETEYAMKIDMQNAYDRMKLISCWRSLNKENSSHNGSNGRKHVYHLLLIESLSMVKG